jgi:hypothetical protein
MAKPTRLAKAGVRHVILYLAGTKSYAMLLPYKVNGSKLDSIHGRDGNEDSCEKVEVFTDSDWAGDQSSSTTRRRHSVSSAMIFLNGRPVTSWSRSQRSIALSSCESEYLSAVGGAAEGLYVGRLWRFLTRKEVAVNTITDSSSCRAFSQRQGVGRLKHIDAKFLWVQQRLKEGAMAMEGVPTLLNVADIGTKRLTKVRRAFLMYLMGMVQYDESSDSYVAVGEWEFAEELRRRTMAKNMKAVKQVMLNTLMDIPEGGSLPISTNFVKLVTLMAMQPVVTGLEMQNAEVKLIEARSTYYGFFNVYPLFLVAFVFIGFVAGFYFNKFVYNERVRRIMAWTNREIRRLHRRRLVVDDWDPINQELRQYRIHEQPQDADSGEEYFRETENGLARYVRPHYPARLRLGAEELDPLEAMQLEEPSENEESQAAEIDAEVQTEITFSKLLRYQQLLRDQWPQYQSLREVSLRRKSQNTSVCLDLPGARKAAICPTFR